MFKILHEDFNLGFISRYVVERDISIFLKHDFHRLKKKYALINWPNIEYINHLIQKCDLSFIYTFIIYRFINDELNRPNKRFLMLL